MYITIVFILTGLRRCYFINVLGNIENSVRVCIIFHNMVGCASVCAVTWRSPRTPRLFRHSFSILVVCVHRSCRTCDRLLVADSHIIHISASALFRIIDLFIPEIFHSEIILKKRQHLRVLTKETRRYILCCQILPPGCPNSSHSDRIYPCFPLSSNILFMSLGGLC
jgi:hypothetical protein